MKIEWATIDRHGQLLEWSSEQYARLYVENRIKAGNANPGQEKVVRRTVSDWKEVKN